jgi:DNA-binding CsgD family transcriptional regulator
VSGHAQKLLDRAPECLAIDQLLAGARGGTSGTLVFAGETGIGKTALLNYAIASAGELRVENVVGFETEMELSFAALHQLLSSMLGGLDELPGPQRDAIASAFGLVEAGAPDRLLVGLGVLALLSNVAAEKPLLCTIDDAQYLDQASEQILAFLARRLDAEGIAFIFVIGAPPGRPMLLEGLPQMRLKGLSDKAAGALLDGGVSGPLDGGVRARLLAELHGNPLALNELPCGLTPAQLAGSTVLPTSIPLGNRIQGHFLRRMRRLPMETQSLLLLLAAELAGDQDVLWRAAGELGIGRSALGPAESAGLVIAGPPVTFRDSLARTALYGAADPTERRRVHAALAFANDAAPNAHRHAWHRAGAAVGVDEEVAAELESSADTALTRDGYSASAALLQRAAELTPDATARANRTLAAARAQIAAGSGSAALTLLNGMATTDEHQGAQMKALQSQIMFDRLGMDESPELLLEAARELEPFDLRLARDAHLEALCAALYAGSLGGTGAVLAAGKAGRATPAIAESEETSADLLLDGLALLVTEGHAAAAPTLTRAIAMVDGRGDLRWYMFACNAAADLWDDEALRSLVMHWARTARDAGALTALARALVFQGTMYETVAGRFDAADELIEQSHDLFMATGAPGLSGRSNAGGLFVTAWRGHEADARPLAEEVLQRAVANGLGGQVAFAHHALAVLEVGLGQYEAAVAHAREACTGEALYSATWSYPELVEAAVRCGEADLAEEGVRRLEATVLPSGTDWGLGMLARSRALTTKNGNAEALYVEALERLGRSRATPQLARAMLLYGEWLRRARRPRDARAQLRAAYQLFASMGATAFAQRAETELAATGEHPHERTPAAADLLTPHELRIARLVADGASNPEIGARLFISPRTVEYHLHKVFRKLEINSRTRIARALGHIHQSSEGPQH